MREFKSVQDILEFAMEQEQKAVDFYKHLASIARSDDMKAIFEQFAKEEIQHKARLNQILTDGIMTLQPQVIQDLKVADYLVSEEPSPDITYEQALVLAMKKEKAAFKLYTNLAEKVDNPELKQIFQLLAIEESKHKLRFELEYDQYVLREN